MLKLIKVPAMSNVTGPIGITCRAIIVSILLCSAAFIHLWHNGPNDPSALHIDESIYLKLPRDAFLTRSPESIYVEHTIDETISSYLVRYPSAITDFLVGNLSSFLTLGPVELGLFLDLLCSIISYLFLSRLYFRIFPNRLAAESATIISLSFPWLLIPSQYYDFSIPGLRYFYPAFYLDYSLSTLRGVYTQISFCLFVISIDVLGSLCTTDKARAFSWFLLGGLSASLIYVYVFGWAAVLGIIPQTLILNSFQKSADKKAFRGLVSRLFGFSAGHLIVGIPGLILMKHQDFMELVRSPLFGKVRFFSPVMTLLAITIFAFFIRNRNSPPIFFAISVIISSVISETILMNMQPILGQSITPYQIPTKYIHPLVSGILFTLLIRAIFSNPRTVLYRYVLTTIPIFIFSIRSYVLAQQSIDELGKSKEIAELISAISKTPAKTTIAIRSPNSPLAPLIATMTDRQILFQDWISWKKITMTESVKREMAVGWIFSGEPRLLWPCVYDEPNLPGDILTLTWTDRLIKRAQYCKAEQAIIKNYSSCDILRDFQIDYILWSHTFNFKQPKWYKTFAQTVWRSDEGTYELLRFMRTEALSHFCRNDRKSAE